MKHQQFSEPQSGKLVCQLLRGLNIAYNLTKEKNSEKRLHHALMFGEFQ